jgi:hypothetical protein
MGRVCETKNVGQPCGFPSVRPWYFPPRVPVRDVTYPMCYDMVPSRDGAYRDWGGEPLFAQFGCVLHSGSGFHGRVVVPESTESRGWGGPSDPPFLGGHIDEIAAWHPWLCPVFRMSHQQRATSRRESVCWGPSGTPLRKVSVRTAPPPPRLKARDW